MKTYLVDLYTLLLVFKGLERSKKIKVVLELTNLALKVVGCLYGKRYYFHHHPGRKD